MFDPRPVLPAIDRILLHLLHTWQADHPGEPAEPGKPAFFGMDAAQFGCFAAHGVLPAGYRPPGWRGDAVEIGEEAADVLLR